MFPSVQALFGHQKLNMASNNNHHFGGMLFLSLRLSKQLVNSLFCSLIQIEINSKNVLVGGNPEKKPCSNAENQHQIKSDSRMESDSNLIHVWNVIQI